MLSQPPVTTHVSFESMPPLSYGAPIYDNMIGMGEGTGGHGWAGKGDPCPNPSPDLYRDV